MSIKKNFQVLAVMVFLSFGGSIFFQSYAQEYTFNVEENFSADENSDLQQIISLDYKGADIASVLKSIAYSYDLNLVITKDIKGLVTIVLRDVTIKEALQAILDINGYKYKRKGKLIYIVKGDGIEESDQKTVSISLKYLMASETEILLKKVISSKGDIQINEATNSLILTDFEANIQKVKNLLNTIDIQPIQVLIEAKIIDIQTKVFENMGITHNLTYDPQGSQGGLFERATGFDESLVATTTLTGPSTTLSGGQFTFAATMKGLTASTTLDALIQDKKANLLASPSIATLSGKEARIIIGEKFPYTEKTQTTTGTTETTRFIDVGTTLRVTPFVSPDGWITMNVHPEVSSVSASLDAGPRITTREADATIRVKDGQTIIIGGLINKQDDRTTGGIPGLKNIPVVGKLFSHNSEDWQETELTVFITPRITLSPYKANAQDQDDSAIQTEKESWLFRESTRQ